MDTPLDRLRHQLVEGFRDARVPSSVDDIADDFEVPQARELVGKRWTDTPVETLSRMTWDLHWFKLPGLRAYLPAFMLAAASGEAETAETVISFLAGSGERTALWPDEMRAVRMWLHFMRDELKNQDAAKALASYWEHPPIKPIDDERVALFRRARDVFEPHATPPEATELAAAVVETLGDRHAPYRPHVAGGSALSDARRVVLALVLSLKQLRFMVDFLDYACRRYPSADDDATLKFWRDQLAARGG